MATWQLLLKLLESTVELSGMHFPVSSAINYETVKLLMPVYKKSIYIFTVQFRVSMTISTIWID
jgi:hypothetical protein